MSFEEKMQVASLVLDYLRVVFGYPVTIPLFAGFLCYLFRASLREKILGMKSASYGKLKLAWQQYTQDVTRTAKETARAVRPRDSTSTKRQSEKDRVFDSFFPDDKGRDYAQGYEEGRREEPQHGPPAASVNDEAVNKSIDALATFFGLSARLLPLIPKAERRKFIEHNTASLPEEFSRFRLALYELAERAPEAPPQVAERDGGLDDFIHAGE